MNCNRAGESSAGANAGSFFKLINRHDRLRLMARDRLVNQLAIHLSGPLPQPPDRANRHDQRDRRDRQGLHPRRRL
jgi:hypothetical protein